ncbi:MAG: hypothetical protein ACRBBW_06190 [Cellvibrionaceae bacterium]
MCDRKASSQRTGKTLKLAAKTVIAATATLAIGCATTPPAPPSVDQVQVHSVAQIKQAIRADKLSQICTDISKNKRSDAQSLYQSWLAKHWKIVVGADAHYRSTLSANTMAFEGQTLAMPALRLYADEVEASNAKFSYLSRVKTDPSRICLRKMQETLAKIESAENVETALLNLADKHPQPPSMGDRVPTFAGSFTIDAESGRSHYQVEQAAKNMSCTTPKIITFKNQWPSEIYGAFCTDDHQLISCEWGKCKLL